MAIGNMQTKFGKDHVCGSGDMLADRQTDKQTDTQTDVLITILRHRSHGRSNNCDMHVTACYLEILTVEWQRATD